MASCAFMCVPDSHSGMRECIYPKCLLASDLTIQLHLMSNLVLDVSLIKASFDFVWSKTRSSRRPTRLTDTGVKESRHADRTSHTRRIFPLTSGAGGHIVSLSYLFPRKSDKVESRGNVNLKLYYSALSRIKSDQLF